MDPRADAAWVAGLAGSRAGRLLASHLAAVEVHGSDHDCAMQEALANERVFVHALARSAHNHRPFPCGLPPRLPCFIAILNLSGERMVVYSDSSALIRSLCAHSTVLHRNELEERLLLFEMHPTKRTTEEMRFVLCSYSLPWQAGADASYWHLSACAISVATDGVERALVDRQPQFSSDSATPFRGKSALDSRDKQLPLYVAAPGVLELVSDKQIAEFVEAYSATCLDKASGPAGVAAAATAAAAVGGGGGGANEQIRSLNQRLLQDRDRDQTEIKDLKRQTAALVETLNSTVNEALDTKREMEAQRLDEVGDAQKKAKELVDHAREQYEALCVEMKGMEATQKDVARETRKQKKQNEALIARCDELDRQGAAKNALHNAALSQHVATISGLEGKLEKSRAEARIVRSELEREHAVATEREAAQHAEAMSKVVAGAGEQEAHHQPAERGQRGARRGGRVAQDARGGAGATHRRPREPTSPTSPPSWPRPRSGGRRQSQSRAARRGATRQRRRTTAPRRRPTRERSRFPNPRWAPRWWLRTCPRRRRRTRARSTCCSSSWRSRGTRRHRRRWSRLRGTRDRCPFRILHRTTCTTTTQTGSTRRRRTTRTPSPGSVGRTRVWAPVPVPVPVRFRRRGARRQFRGFEV